MLASFVETFSAMRRLLRPSLALLLCPIAAASAADGAATDPGRALFQTSCVACHRADGTGAGRMGPALVGSPAVSGPPAPLIDIVLRGSRAELPKDRPRYGIAMPGFAKLDDRQVADLVSFLRSAFGDGAAPVTPEQVAAVRGRR